MPKLIKLTLSSVAKVRKNFLINRKQITQSKKFCSVTFRKLIVTYFGVDCDTFPE